MVTGFSHRAVQPVKNLLSEKQKLSGIAMKPQKTAPIVRMRIRYTLILLVKLLV